MSGINPKSKKNLGSAHQELASAVESTNPPSRVPFTKLDFQKAKIQGKKISVITAYDYTSAQLLDSAGIDCLLVGDSLGMVIQGQSDALSVTMEQMIYHSRCVRQGTKNAFVVTDLPFMTYQVSPEQALINAGQLIQSGRAQGVKLEGGIRSAAAISKITQADIPVMGHIGLTPQSIHQFGGFRVQRNEEKLINDALAVQDSGAFALVLECIPAELAKTITSRLTIPTIGIGAGPHCDGQVLVFHDLLGMFSDLKPKFVKIFAAIGEQIKQAAQLYQQEIQSGTYPDTEHSFR